VRPDASTVRDFSAIVLVRGDHLWGHDRLVHLVLPPVYALVVVGSVVHRLDVPRPTHLRERRPHHKMGPGLAVVVPHDEVLPR
jgi:hypothetical protein